MKGDQEKNAEREVVIMLTDMVGYSRLTNQLPPDKVRDFIVNYHRILSQVIQKPAYEPVEIEPSAGDGALIIFGKRPGEDTVPMSRRARAAATDLAYAIERKRLVPTRIGLYRGNILEAQVGGKSAKFGAGIAVASRLEELCDYFGTSLLMDRDVALLEEGESTFLVSIGKVTPQDLNHPVHLLSVYGPGLHRLPETADRDMLTRFITIKNEAMLQFCGNEKLSISPDFPKAKAQLEQAKSIYFELCGTVDIATERILEYIRENPFPGSDFKHLGMKIHGSKHDSLGVRLFHLSKELLKAIDMEFYQALVVETGWEACFTLEWCKQGEVIVTVNEKADGIYYIDNGTVVTLDEEGQSITTLGAGNIFGEMAYFSKERLRNATVVAASDVVLRKISTRDFDKFPVIQKIFKRIASRRKSDSPIPSQ